MNKLKKNIIYLMCFSFSCSSLTKSKIHYYSSLPSQANFLLENSITPISFKKKFLFLSLEMPSEGLQPIWEYMVLKNKKLWEEIQLQNEKIEIIYDKNSQFDFLIETIFFFEENNYHLIQILKHSNQKVFAKFEFIFGKQVYNSSSLVYYDTEKFHSLKQVLGSNSYVWKKLPSLAEISKQIEDVFYGKIFFYSSPNSEVECNGKKLSKTPFSLRLFEGKYECIFSVSKLLKKRTIVFVESNKEKKIFIEFEKRFHSSTILEAMPGPVEAYLNDKSFGLTPVSIPLEKKIDLKLFQSQKIYSLNFSFYPKVEEPLVLFPYMMWDAFHPVFYSFWQIPQSPALSFEMNSYLSLVNESKREVMEWNYLKSHPILPEKYILKGSFFPPEETNEGLFLFDFGNEEDSISIEVEVDRVSVYHFPSSNQDLVTFFYPLQEERTLRKFEIQTNPNKETIEIYFNSELILRKKFSFSKPWRILLAGKGKIFNRLNALSELKIACIDFLTSEQTETWEREKTPPLLPKSQ
jgi:hypothetical protein